MPDEVRTAVTASPVVRGFVRVPGSSVFFPLFGVVEDLASFVTLDFAILHKAGASNGGASFDVEAGLVISLGVVKGRGVSVIFPVFGGAAAVPVFWGQDFEMLDETGAITGAVLVDVEAGVVISVGVVDGRSALSFVPCFGGDPCPDFFTRQGFEIFDEIGASTDAALIVFQACAVISLGVVEGKGLLEIFPFLGVAAGSAFFMGQGLGIFNDIGANTGAALVDVEAGVVVSLGVVEGRDAFSFLPLFGVAVGLAFVG